MQAILGRLAAGENLTSDEAATAFEAVMEGRAREGEIALLLTSLRAKGETVAELAGAATAVRRHMTRIRSARSGLVDTCGTGGTGSRIFNVSTAAALVTAAAGVPVAKHGNRSVTSRSGSADVLASLGVNVEADVRRVEQCLDELGICFCFAPLLHPAMRHAAAVRKKLGVGTIFNLLGPLANPASAEFQVLGVGRAELRALMAEALAMLGTQRAIVVGGDDSLGEVSIAAPTQVIEVSAAGCREFTWTPVDFGLTTQSLDSIEVESAQHSAARVRGVLAGKQGAARDIVLANAAAALWVAGRVDTPLTGAKLAAAALDSGAAAALLERLVEYTNR